MKKFETIQGLADEKFRRFRRFSQRLLQRGNDGFLLFYLARQDFPALCKAFDRLPIFLEFGGRNAKLRSKHFHRALRFVHRPLKSGLAVDRQRASAGTGVYLDDESMTSVRVRADALPGDCSRFPDRCFGMKNVEASGKDKLELMGHTSDEMLRYYQDVSIGDLRKITDQI